MKLLQKKIDVLRGPTSQQEKPRCKQDRNNLLFYPGKLTERLGIFEFLKSHLEFSRKEGEKGPEMAKAQVLHHL